MYDVISALAFALAQTDIRRRKISQEFREKLTSSLFGKVKVLAKLVIGERRTRQWKNLL